MDSNSLISEINSILKKRWSRKQPTTGKWVEVKWEWSPDLNVAVNKYRECGWEVSKQVEIAAMGKRIWLVFVNPHWRKGVMIKELPY